MRKVTRAERLWTVIRWGAIVRFSTHCGYRYRFLPVRKSMGVSWEELERWEREREREYAVALVQFDRFT